jgi:hypothetical protein
MPMKPRLITMTTTCIDVGPRKCMMCHFAHATNATPCVNGAEHEMAAAQPCRDVQRTHTGEIFRPGVSSV